MLIVENLLYLVPVLIAGQPLAHEATSASSSWRRAPCSWQAPSIASTPFSSALTPGPGWHYFPAIPEILITLGIVAIELMAYLYFVKRFPVLPKAEHA